MRESGYEEVLSSGIVLTGGSAVMPGMVELGEDIFLKACAPWGSAIQQRFGRHGVANTCRHRDGLARRSTHGTHAWHQGVAKKQLGQNSDGPRQRLVCGELLNMLPASLLYLARGSPHAHRRKGRRCRPCIRHSTPFMKRECDETKQKTFKTWQLQIFKIDRRTI